MLKNGGQHTLGKHICTWTCTLWKEHRIHLWWGTKLQLVLQQTSELYSTAARRERVLITISKTDLGNLKLEHEIQISLHFQHWVELWQLPEREVWKGTELTVKKVKRKLVRMLRNMWNICMWKNCGIFQAGEWLEKRVETDVYKFRRNAEKK